MKTASSLMGTLRCYPGQHILSRAAPRTRGSLQRRNTRSCPLYSYTPEDTSHTPHTHSHLSPKRENRRSAVICEVNVDSVRLADCSVAHLHRCVFHSLWACSLTCRSTGSLPPSGQYSCVHRCCHCMCARCHDLTREDTCGIFRAFKLGTRSQLY